MAKNLQSRKRQLVRDAIYDAAIELFAKRGFDETTVEDVAEAAGISRRSFFRYFETKDDLLALNTVHCGELLIETVASCPAGLSPLDVVREAVLAGAKFTESQPRTHQIIEISKRSATARQAHLSRLNEVVEKLSSEYASRMKGASMYQMRPSLLAGMTQLILNVATASWFMEDHKDMSTAAKQGFQTLTRIFCDEPTSSSGKEATSSRKAPDVKAPKKLLKTRKS